MTACGIIFMIVVVRGGVIHGIPTISVYSGEMAIRWLSRQKMVSLSVLFRK